MNPPTGRRRKGTGGPPPQLAPHHPRMPPSLPGDREKSKLRIRRCATWISVDTYFSSQLPIFQSWPICQESQVQ
jgi:hypothetical protein